jgi:hypothetical protein
MCRYVYEMHMERVRIRSRMVALLAVLTLSCGVFTAVGAGADADTPPKGVCILLGSRLVGSSGGRYNVYDLKVRLINEWGKASRIVAIVSNQYGRTYAIGATVSTSATRITRVHSPHGSVFRVTGCSWSSA